MMTTIVCFVLGALALLFARSVGAKNKVEKIEDLDEFFENLEK
jgi:hypothetical protein